jgi:hypothetical protein
MMTGITDKEALNFVGPFILWSRWRFQFCLRNYDGQII